MAGFVTVIATFLIIAPRSLTSANWLRCWPHHLSEMICALCFSNHRPGNPLGTVPIIEFLDGEGEAVAVAVVDAEDLGGTISA